MSLNEDLHNSIKDFFRKAWTSRDGSVVPVPEDLKLGNDAVKLDATVLYADMSGSTAMVDTMIATKAAEVYKAYMTCAARIITSEGGTITAYDGDRIMAVFIGTTKNTSCVRAAMKIDWALEHIVNPEYEEMYGAGDFRLKHLIGVDTSELSVARIGVRGDNDLLWVGPAANYAAKLANFETSYSGVFITDRVFTNMNDNVKYRSAGHGLMWERGLWLETNNLPFHKALYYWPVH